MNSNQAKPQLPQPSTKRLAEAINKHLVPAYLQQLETKKAAGKEESA